MRRVVIAVVLFLSACGEVKESKHQPSPDERALTPDEKKQIASHVLQKMRDPDSTIFKFPELSKRKYGRFPDNYCFFVNSKNGYGGYEGFSSAAARVKYDSDNSMSVSSVDVSGFLCFDKIDYSAIPSEGAQEIISAKR